MRLMLVATAAALLSASPVVAAPTTRVVHLTGLDLSRAVDAKRLDRRVAGAIETVCGSYANTARDEQDAIDACRQAATADYRAQLAAMRDRAATGLAAR